MKKQHLIRTAILGTFLIATPVVASSDIATVNLSSAGVDFQLNASREGSYSLTVSGPADYHFQKAFEAGQAPFFSTFNKAGQALETGTYVWTLTHNPVASDDRAVAATREGLNQSGAFTIQADGAVANPNLIENLDKAQTFTTDLIVQGSGCFGFDCTSTESFGFDTLRLKENNLRVHFDDTSSAGSFPNNDWRITINDSTNGGANFFSVDDATGGKVPFKIEANSPNNTLYVASEGRIGVQTANPVVGIHHTDGNTPTLRLEQDGSDGFTPQTWDLAGNETNFFVRDVTNSSKLPFRIKPGAPDDSLYIAASGNVGLGTDNPSEDVHVQRADARIRVQDNSSATDDTRIQLALQNNGAAQVSLEDTNAATDWRVQNLNSNLRFTLAGTGNAEAEIDGSGNMVIRGTLTTGGTQCGSGCDRVFQPGYELETIEEHAEMMWNNSYLPSVGPTVEGEPFNVTEKTGRMLNELEKAHIFIERLHNRLSEREAQLDELTDILERVSSLEQQINN